MITTLSLSQKDQNKTLVLSESVGMEEGAGRAMMNVNAGDSFMKKFQDFIQEACGLWDKFLALWSSRNNSC
jgi:hypothetical protein